MTLRKQSSRKSPFGFFPFVALVEKNRPATRKSPFGFFSFAARVYRNSDGPSVSYSSKSSLHWLSRKKKTSSMSLSGSSCLLLSRLEIMTLRKRSSRKSLFGVTVHYPVGSSLLLLAFIEIVTPAANYPLDSSLLLLALK